MLGWQPTCSGLTVANPTSPKRPPDVGPALDLTNEQIDQASEVTTVDVEAGKALWIHAAPKALRDLLDAQRD